MRPHPDDVIHLILAEFIQDAGTNGRNHLNSSITSLKTIGAIASACHRFRSIAQPALYETVRLNVRDRTDQLRILLEQNSHLVAGTKTLILGDATFAPPVIDLSGNTLNRTDGTRYDYLVSPGSADLLGRFLKLESLHLSEMTIQLESVRVCFAQLHSVRELRVDHCTFSSIAALRALYTSLFNLETLHLLSFGIAENPPSHHTGEEQVAVDHIGEQQTPRLRMLKLDPLWNPRAEDPTARICNDIIRSGQVDYLRVLEFNHNERQRLSSLGRLVRHTARTIESLSLDCGIYGSHVPIPDFGSLPQLKFLRIRGINPLSVVEAAGLLAALTRASPTPEVVLHLSTSSHMVLLRDLEPLWLDIEAATNCSRIELNITHSRWSSSPDSELGEQEVRDLLTKTVAREALFLSITTTIT